MMMAGWVLGRWILQTRERTHGDRARTLLVIREHDLNLEKSTRNLAGVKTILAGNLNPSDVLIADTVVFTRSALGELEEWLATHGVEPSKSNKRAWANAAAQRVQQLGKQSGDVWDFVSDVANYLVSR